MKIALQRRFEEADKKCPLQGKINGYSSKAHSKVLNSTKDTSNNKLPAIYLRQGD